MTIEDALEFAGSQELRDTMVSINGWMTALGYEGNFTGADNKKKAMTYRRDGDADVSFIINQNDIRFYLRTPFVENLDRARELVASAQRLLEGEVTTNENGASSATSSETRIPIASRAEAERLGRWLAPLLGLTRTEP